MNPLKNLIRKLYYSNFKLYILINNFEKEETNN
jgi:hypothetical protein